MIDRFRDIACALVAVLLLGIACAAAQTSQLPTSLNLGVAPQAGSTPTPQAPAQSAGPASPQINIAEITARANQGVGVSIQMTIAGWQRELDQLEGDLQKPHLRYSELNALRDDLQRVRAGIEDFSKRLEPPLAAAKDQVALLGPAPAAGQSPEPESVALNRAELNYHFGLLSAGEAAVHSANLRIDHLINTIQDIRRKNFASRLFQPVPGIYSYQTWTNLPDYAPSAMRRVRDLLANWWDSVRDQDEVLHVAVEAVLLWLVLTLAAWHGVRRLRRWGHEGEPPFWRQCVIGGRRYLAPDVAGCGANHVPIRNHCRNARTARTRRLDFLLGSAIDHHHFCGQCACHHGVRTEGISVAVHPRFRPCSGAHLRSRPGACDCLRRYDADVRRHPPCAGPIRADGSGRVSVKSTPSRDRRRHPSDSAGRAASGQNAVATMAHRVAYPHLGHSCCDHCAARRLPVSHGATARASPRASRTRRAYYMLPSVIGGPGGEGMAAASSQSMPCSLG